MTRSATTAPKPAASDDRWRHLAACPDCSAQYDVTSLAAGARFRCACGTVVDVGAPRPHEAAVVRCSACGAPRQGGSAACGFCGSDFTIHERDLATICPGCAARISDRARFCHACGLPIAPIAGAAEATRKACPACVEERLLSSRELGGPGLTVLECHHCAGLWLGAQAFRLVERRARELQGTVSPAPVQPPVAGDRSPPSGARAYRPCPDCGKLMHRRNYGRRSGVVIDQCATHGLWFDYGELSAILRWIRDGGLRRAEELDALRRQEASRGHAPARLVEPLFESGTASGGKGGLIGGLVDFLSRFA